MKTSSVITLLQAGLISSGWDCSTGYVSEHLTTLLDAHMENMHIEVQSYYMKTTVSKVYQLSELLVVSHVIIV